MDLLKKAGRRIILPFISSIGAEKFFSKFSKNEFLILNYHGVVSRSNFNLSVNHVSVSQFEKHLIYLSKNFNVVPIKEAFERTTTAKRKKSIAITFDDGYENNYLYAYPLLKKLNMPATIFVVAQGLYKPDEALWYDKIDLLKSIADISEVLQNIYPLKLKKEVQSYGALKRYLKMITPQEKTLIMNAIDDMYGTRIHKINNEFWKLLNAEQIKEMSQSGLVEIGSHSLTHPNLDTLEDEALFFELKESKSIIEQATSSEVRSIAFPDGAYDERVKKFCINAGYSQLLSVDTRLASDDNQEFILPRLSISNTTTFESVMLNVHMGFSKRGFR